MCPLPHNAENAEHADGDCPPWYWTNEAQLPPSEVTSPSSDSPSLAALSLFDSLSSDALSLSNTSAAMFPSSLTTEASDGEPPSAEFPFTWPRQPPNPTVRTSAKAIAVAPVKPVANDIAAARASSVAPVARCGGSEPPCQLGATTRRRERSARGHRFVTDRRYVVTDHPLRCDAPSGYRPGIGSSSP